MGPGPGTNVNDGNAQNAQQPTVPTVANRNAAATQAAARLTTTGTGIAGVSSRNEGHVRLHAVPRGSCLAAAGVPERVPELLNASTASLGRNILADTEHHEGRAGLEGRAGQGRASLHEPKRHIGRCADICPFCFC